MDNVIDLSNEANRLPVIKYRDYDNSVKEFDPRAVLPFSTKELPFETQATTYFVIAQLTEQANFNWKNAKVQQDKLRSDLYVHYIQKAQDEGAKRPTENALSALIIGDSEFIKASNYVNAMERNYRTLLRFTSAMEQRKDMIQSMSASKRAELNSGFNDIRANDPNAETHARNSTIQNFNPNNQPQPRL